MEKLKKYLQQIDVKTCLITLIVVLALIAVIYCPLLLLFITGIVFLVIEHQNRKENLHREQQRNYREYLYRRYYGIAEELYPILREYDFMGLKLHGINSIKEVDSMQIRFKGRVPVFCYRVQLHNCCTEPSQFYRMINHRLQQEQGVTPLHAIIVARSEDTLNLFVVEVTSKEAELLVAQNRREVQEHFQCENTDVTFEDEDF